MPPMTEAVQIQMVIVFGSILTAIVGATGVIIVAMLNRTRQHAKVAADQTANSHKNPDGTPLNLRDDLDEKFEGLADLVKGLGLDIGGMKSDIRGIRKDASDDRNNANEAIATERSRIRKLEDTLTPAQLNRLRAETKETP
jgi:hypothetical protein